MSSLPVDGLPIRIGDLLNKRSIEGNRIDFKSTWDDFVKVKTVQTVCAFANDLLNLGGGYVVLGVEESGGSAVFPVRGLPGLNPEAVQKEVRYACERIQPRYQPLVFVAHADEKPLVVIWAPGGDNRPYEAPEELKKGSPLHHYIRRGPETKQANSQERRQLLELAAKIPFDDRRNTEARIEDISSTLVRRFLIDVGSELAREGSAIEPAQVYRQMNLVVRVNAHEVPRNVALLLFNEEPDRFFPGAYTEVVQFESSGDLQEERSFRGPLQYQIESTLSYLEALGGRTLRKVQGRAEAERTIPYPYEAMREAVVNALYHRGYDGPPEPVKVYLYADRLEIISYPGPVPGIERRQFESGDALPPVPARNRRIGDFLKELRLAERRGTGIPKIERTMKENGSPPARFDFDEERTYFRVTLPVHPRYFVANALREAEHLWAIGERRSALESLARSHEQQPASGELASRSILYALELKDDAAADRAFARFRAAGGSAAELVSREPRLKARYEQGQAPSAVE